MKVNKFTTTKLNEIYSRWCEHGLATSNVGSDYQDLIPEIEAELIKRQSINADKAIKHQMRQLNEFEAHTATTRTCTQCQKEYPLSCVDLFFSTTSEAKHRYRSACKECHAKKAKERRSLAKIEVPF